MAMNQLARTEVLIKRSSRARNKLRRKYRNVYDSCFTTTHYFMAEPMGLYFKSLGTGEAVGQIHIEV